MEKLLCVKDLTQILGLSKSGIYNLIRGGAFPAGIQLGHAKRWTEKEVLNWINELAETGTPAPVKPAGKMKFSKTRSTK